MKNFILIALLFCFTNSAWGSGYQLRYQGAESMGTAFASAGSNGASLSSIYYNPALFLLQDKNKSVALEFLAIHPTKAKFTSSTDQVSNNYVSSSFSGSLYYGHKVSDETAITVAITAPWATASDYNAKWEGRYHALKTSLKTINMQPIITQKVSNKFMFSIGPQIQYMTSRLSKATNFGPNGDLISDFNGSNLNIGGILALTYIPTEKTTLAFNYTSYIKHNLRGDLKFSPTELASVGGLVNSSDANSKITTPDVFTLSASHIVSEQLISHFSVSYTNWSIFKDIKLTGNKALNGTLPLINTTDQNWNDTYMLALGSTYYINGKTTLRGGVSYETGAVDNKYRTPRTQDTDRIGLGLGASFTLNTVVLDLGLNHIIYTGDIDLDIATAKPTPTTPAGTPGVTGTYDSSATLLRLGVEYKF